MSHLRRAIALVVLAFIAALVPLGTIVAVSAPASAATAAPMIEPPIRCC
jgi:hypothetical protein